MKEIPVLFAALSLGFAGCGKSPERPGAETEGRELGEFREIEHWETPYGKYDLYQGLPATRNESEKLYDQMEFQRACQVYLWALPLVSSAEWQYQHEAVFEAGDGQLVLYDSYKDKLGILTADATTPYVVAFANLKRTGPLVIDFPAGPLMGGVGDFWQRDVSDMGETGPDRGRGARYLIVGPGQKVPPVQGCRVLQMRMNNIMFGVRSLEPDPEKSKALIAKLNLYPLSQSKNPPRSNLIAPGGKTWSQGQPKGMAYWERLRAIIEEEPVEERDRVMMAMLASLGIEKGRPFRPGGRRQAILSYGAEVGELMAKNLSFNKRFPEARYRPETQWMYVPEMPGPNRKAEDSTESDRRSAWFYQAVTVGNGVMAKNPGAGQVCLGAYRDKEGEWFDGGKNYKLTLPANPPAKQFWSLMVYDSLTRCLIDNPQEIAGKSPRMPDLQKNADGSVDIYMGPKAPPGHEKNWIPTLPDRAWFAYFRLHAPLQPYFDKSWKLPDVEPLD